jgi:hypothetical protein
MDTASDTDTYSDNDTYSDTDTGTETGSVTDTGTIPDWAQDCDLDPESVLFQTIDESAAGWMKEDLCNCFATLNTSWTDNLTELFETGTPEQIANALWEMHECCFMGEGALNGNFEDVEEAFLGGTLCEIPLPYKGIAFPKR